MPSNTPFDPVSPQPQGEANLADAMAAALDATPKTSEAITAAARVQANEASAALEAAARRSGLSEAQAALRDQTRAQSASGPRAQPAPVSSVAQQGLFDTVLNAQQEDNPLDGPPSLLMHTTDWGRESQGRAAFPAWRLKAAQLRWSLGRAKWADKLFFKLGRPPAHPKNAFFWAQSEALDLLDDPQSFAYAAFAHGFADYLLPIDLSDPESFAFGPEGFWPELADRLGGAQALWADQWRRAAREAARAGKTPESILPPPDVDWGEVAALDALGAPNPDLEEPKLRERARQILRQRRDALTILAFLAGAGCSFAVLKALWGTETLQMALLEALVVGRHEKLGVSGVRALQQATRSRTLPSQFAMPALALRKTFERRARALEAMMAYAERNHRESTPPFTDRADLFDPALAMIGPFFDELAPSPASGAVSSPYYDANKSAAENAAAAAAAKGKANAKANSGLAIQPMSGPPVDDRPVDMARAFERPEALSLMEGEDDPIQPFAPRTGPPAPDLRLGAFREKTPLAKESGALAADPAQSGPLQSNGDA